MTTPIRNKLLLQIPKTNFTPSQQSKIIQMTNSNLQLIETKLDQHQVHKDCIPLYYLSGDSWINMLIKSLVLIFIKFTRAAWKLRKNQVNLKPFHHTFLEFSSSCQAILPAWHFEWGLQNPFHSTQNAYQWPFFLQLHLLNQTLHTFYYLLHGRT